MTKTFTVLFIALLIACTFSADCPVDQSKQPKILSDSVSLSAADNKNTKSQNLVYNYQFKNALNAVPTVAIGLNQIQASPSKVLDLRISSPRVTPSGIYFQAESGEESLWKSFKINFAVSTRDDIEFGTISQGRAPTVNPNDNTFNLVYNIKNSLPLNGLTARSFLQGINVYSPDNSKLGVKQIGQQISSKQIFFTFSTPLKRSIIRALSISVIVYNIYTPGVLYAEGDITQNYVVSTLDITIPRHGINELRTYLVGINSFETSAEKPISIFSAVSEKFSIVIGPIDRNEIDYISVSYLILSVIDCGSCSGYPILFNGICQPSCPKGFKVLKGRCVPQKCKQGQKFNEKYECIPICTGNNEKYENGNCICNDDFYRINNECSQCAEGQYYDFVQLGCKPLCGANSKYIKGRCYCDPGYFIINNRCQKCPYGSTYDAASQKCYNICKKNQVFSPEGCVCANGFVKLNGVCSRCPYRQAYDPDTQSCICSEGFENVYGQCIPVCGKNQVRKDGVCQCASGFYLIDQSCQSCPEFSDYSDLYRRCLCRTGFIQTPTGCIPNCTNQQYFSNGRCVNFCKSEYEIFYAGQCQCIQDYERINGKCVLACLINEYRDEDGKCKCIAGYFKGTYPICQKINCPRGTQFDPVRQDCISICKAREVFIRGQCVCGFGYNRLNRYGDCVPNCTQYEVNVNGFCQCAPGYGRAAHGVCCPLGTGLGRCPPGTIFVYGLCLPPTLCGPNEYWCGAGCNCVNGFYRVNGQCVAIQPTLVCPANSHSNGVNCLCNPGFFPVVPGLCDVCPRNTYWNGEKCFGEAPNECKNGWIWSDEKKRCIRIPTCKVNQQWDGASCRCVQGYFYVQGRCQQCPLGTIFDGFKCSPGVPTQYCNDPFSFWNGFTCVCISGYWPLADGKCISCPEQFYWDGTCCKPRDGQFVPLTIVV